MSLSIIVAMSKNRVIGKGGKLPWYIPEDLKRFKQITMGHPIIMGRKTFESIGRPLPGRKNIVITRNKNYRPEGVTVVHSLEEAMKNHPDDEQFVIGGAEIFREAYPLAEKIYLTLIEKEIEGDVFFPNCDLDKDFEILEKGPLIISMKGKIPYHFISMARTIPSAA